MKFQHLSRQRFEKIYMYFAIKIKTIDNKNNVRNSLGINTLELIDHNKQYQNLVGGYQIINLILMLIFIVEYLVSDRVISNIIDTTDKVDHVLNENIEHSTF